MLRADVYRPAGAGRWPVLLLRTPYGKHLFQFTHLSIDPVRAAAAGYVVVIQDTRGRFSSAGGEFAPYRDEFADGFDTVEWAAGLPYADGRVGAYGVSYMGGAAWHAAAAAPPSLRAIAPVQAPEDLFVDLMWRGGALQWGTHVMWSLASLGPVALLRTADGGGDIGREFAELVEHIDAFDEIVGHLPPRTLPAAKPDRPFLPYFHELLDHPTRDPWYHARSMRGRHGAVRVPAMIVAGWHDLLLAGDLSHFARLRSEGATEAARNDTRIVVGPWSHGLFAGVVGELDFGLRANGMLLDLREDLTAMHLRWFDRWLKDGDPVEQPPVRLFIQGRNRWRDEDEWPPARARATPWFLHAGGGLAPIRPAGEADPASYLYDPANPCPTRGGSLLLPRTYPAGPVEQSALLERGDVLSFTSEPLAREVEVTGAVTAVLYAATDAPDTDWMLKLCDVHPDGRTFNVCDGVIRARFRERDWTRWSLVRPEEVVRYEIDMWATSMVFGAGHRIRVLVSSSDFPRYDRNPNTGDLGVEARVVRVAHQRVFSDARRPSCVILPIIES
jgi:putative CocE/NonD family hydrolase